MTLYVSYFTSRSERYSVVNNMNSQTRARMRCLLGGRERTFRQQKDTKKKREKKNTPRRLAHGVSYNQEQLVDDRASCK